jgi:hypothetical protein
MPIVVKSPMVRRSDRPARALQMGAGLHHGAMGLSEM